MAHPLAAEEFRCRSSGRHTECIDADHLLGVRVVDQGLGFAAPVQHIPHGGGGGKHGAGSIDRVAAFDEDLRSRGGAQGFAGHGHPVLAVEGGLVRSLRRGCCAQTQGNQRQNSFAMNHKAPPETSDRQIIH
jgi:hypothetical protein